MSAEQQKIEAAITVLEAQRALLGDSVVDTALAPLRAKLAALTALPAAEAPAQTLKQATILFLDIVGSTTLSQRLDPEETSAVMDGALAQFASIVAAHGGKVLKYAGDSVLAVFGADEAREDDPERAVRSGLALLDAGRQQGELIRRQHGHAGLDVRVGIHTGGVLFGGGVDAEGSIRGQAVNIAARMEQTAPPGTLRISHDTYRHVRGVFSVEPQPPLSVKGVDEAIATYLVQSAKPRAFRVAARGIEGVETGMIGRDAELARLSSILDVVVSERRLQAVTIIGEPGLGKSRLLHELQGALEAQGQRFWLLLGRAHPQSRLQPYGLLRDLLAWRLQIADSDTSAVAKGKLVDGLIPWLGEGGEAKVHLVGQLIGLQFADSPHVRGIEPRLLRMLAFSALHDYLRGLAADGSTPVLLLEDLHWADDDSLDFIAELCRAGDLPLAMVATARPELLERCADWAQGSPAHASMHLGALDAAQGEVLARTLLRRIGEGAAPIRDLLLAQADGNPFYMEELVRMFIDDGVIVTADEHWRVQPEKLRAAHIPTTLVGVLQARIDALTAADRQALQQASIVGYVFWDDALAALDPYATASIPALEARSLIQRHAGSAFEGTPEEAFHHHLMQQVTYDTVLKPARRAGHAAAAQWLAERVGDRPAEYLAITGEHYERAGDYARALDYFHRAAFDAQGRFANQAALEYTERALRNPEATEPRQRDRLYFIQQTVADLMGLRSLQETALARRGEIAESLDDDSMRAGVLGARALLASRRGDEALAFELATQALDVAGRSGNTEAGALAMGQIAWSRYSRGDVHLALRDARDAVIRARQALADEKTPTREQLEVQALTLRAIIEQGAGNLGHARATLSEALALSRERGLRRPQTSVLEALGVLEMGVGHYAQALSYFEASTASAADLGWMIYTAMGRYSMACCHYDLGQSTLALEQLAAAEAAALRCESRDTQALCLHLRARVEAAAGHGSAAEALFGRATAMFESLAVPAMVCQVSADLALLHLAEGRLPEAQQQVEKIAAELAAGMSLAATGDALRPHLACHRVWAATGDSRAAQAIDTAHAELQALAAKTGEEDTQRSILEQVPLHREIVAAWAAQRAAPTDRR